MYQDYRDQVQFFYVYKRLAHPETNNFVEPSTLEERLMHVAEAQRLTGSEIPWLCDAMDDSTNLAFGKPYNGEFVIGPDGVILRQRFWSNPITLRSDLEELLGAVENPTSVEDVRAHFQVEKREVASGVVPRLKLPRGLRALEVVTRPATHPAYFKLRAEMTRGDGETTAQLYLGFYPDPIHKVHWNNAAGPVEVSLAANEAIGLSQTELTGPKVEVAADLDPRMFLLSLQSAPPQETISVKLKAVVCDDAETFCIPITQEFDVLLAPTKDGSTRPGVFLTNMFREVRSFDKDGDRKITPEEIRPKSVTLFMTHIDTDLDNIITFEEIEEFEAMYHAGRGFEVEHAADGT